MSNFIKDFNYDRGRFLEDSDVVSFRVVNDSNVGTDDDYRGFFKAAGTSNGSTLWMDLSNGHSITKLPNQGGYAWLYQDNDSVPQFVSFQIEGANENTKDYPWNINKKWARFDGGSTDLGFNTLTFSDFSVSSSVTEFNPINGAEMTFTANNSTWNGSNFNSFITPMGVNSLMLNAKLSFIEGLDRTKILLNYLQSKTTGAITGDEAFTGNLNYVNFGERDTIYYNNFEDLELGGIGDSTAIKQALSNDQLIVTEHHGGTESIVSVFDQIGPIHGAGSSTRISSNNISFKALELRDSARRYGLQFSGFPEQAEYIVSGKFVAEPRYNDDVTLEVRSSLNGFFAEGQSTTAESSGRFKKTIAQSNPGPTREEQKEFKTGAIVGPGGVLEVNMIDMRATAADSAVQIDEIAIMKNEGAVMNLDNSGIYQNFSGSQISDFSVTDIGKDIYKIDVALFNNTVSPVLNNGQGFIKPVQYQSTSETSFAFQDFSMMFKQFYINNHANDPRTGYEVYNKFDVIEKTGTNDFKWVCFSGGTAEIAIPFPDTEIYEETWPTIRSTYNSLPEGADRTKKVSANSKPTRTTLNLTAGKFYRATKYINITRNNQQHVIAPFSFAGQAFSFMAGRNSPHRIFMCNISNSEQKIKRTRSDSNTTSTTHGGVNQDTSKEEMTFQPGQIREMDVTNLGVHYLTGVEGTSNTFDRNFIVASVALSTPTSSADVDKMLIPPVVTSNRQLNTYTYRRRRILYRGGTHRNLLHQTIPDSFVKENAVYAQAGVATTEIGDGNGSDAAMSIGINNLYNYAAYGNKLQDYAIVTPYSGQIDVSYYSGDSWYLYKSHELEGGDGTLTEGNPFPQGLNPDFVYERIKELRANAPYAGVTDGTFFNDQNLWKFESTCPVGIWINDPSADEELLVGTNAIIGNINSQRRPHGLHNYFYVSEDTKCLGPELFGEAGFTGGIGATRSFFWEPDKTVPIKVDGSARIRKFKYSFDKMLNVSKNQNRIDRLELLFSNRTDKEAYSLLHFLESHLGYKHFVYKHNLDAINKNKVFYCPQWNHVFNYKDSNTIKATFVEIVSPVVPEL